jgi:shikimate kinase
MRGRATAPAAGTVLNALATGYGSAFGIAEYGEARVELDDSGRVIGQVTDEREVDTALIERCVELCVERFGDGEGGVVETESEVPMAAGLKSSSTIANATVLATLDALGVYVVDDVTHRAADGRVDFEGVEAKIDWDGTDGQEIDGRVLNGSWEAASEGSAITTLEATRIGVRAARDAGVTATGAFDDASASMLGGLTVTDNLADDLLQYEVVDWDVLVWTPPKQAMSAEADHEACKRVSPIADEVLSLAREGKYKTAMMLNGLGFCAALQFSTEPVVEALPTTEGVSLSGTGPSFTAVGKREPLEEVKRHWKLREGEVWFTQTVSEGAKIL